MPNAVLSAYKEQINQLTSRRDDALRRLQALTKTADEIRAVVSGMDELLLALQEFVRAQETGESPSEVQQVPGRVSPARKRASGNSKKEKVAKATRTLIEEAGRPMSRAELYSLLIDQGLKIEGSNPEMVLSTMLWRAGEKAGVVRLRSGGYWLIERDWPDARYYPSLQKLVEESGVMDDLLGD